MDPPRVVVENSLGRLLVGADVGSVLLGIGKVQHADALHLDVFVAVRVHGMVVGECLWATLLHTATLLTRTLTSSLAPWLSTYLLSLSLARPLSFEGSHGQPTINGPVSLPPPAVRRAENS